VERLNQVRRAVLTLSLVVLSIFLLRAPDVRASEFVSDPFFNVKLSIVDQIRPIGDRQSAYAQAGRTSSLRSKPHRFEIGTLDSEQLPGVGFRRCFLRQGLNALPAPSATLLPYAYDAQQLLRVSHFGMATKSVGLLVRLVAIPLSIASIEFPPDTATLACSTADPSAEANNSRANSSPA
jgi:hypothetical protein